MTNQVIPEAAVQAAAMVLLTETGEGVLVTPIDVLIRAALEAAAPHITGHAIAYLDEAGRMISTDPEVTDYERGFDDAIRGMSAKVKRLLNGEPQ